MVSGFVLFQIAEAAYEYLLRIEGELTGRAVICPSNVGACQLWFTRSSRIPEFVSGHAARFLSQTKGWACLDGKEEFQYLYEKELGRHRTLYNCHVGMICQRDYIDTAQLPIKCESVRKSDNANRSAGKVPCFGSDETYQQAPFGWQ